MTQHEKIIKYLDSGKELTVAQARSRFGVTNLSARVHELRTNGHVIDTVTTKSGKSAYAKSTNKRGVKVAKMTTK
jgi:hypothetical protein